MFTNTTQTTRILSAFIIVMTVVENETRKNEASKEVEYIEKYESKQSKASDIRVNILDGSLHAPNNIVRITCVCMWSTAR